MPILSETIVISKDIAEEIQRYLRVAAEHFAGDEAFWEKFWNEDTGPISPLTDETTVSATAVFANGMEMDVKLCGSDGSAPWTEAVLFKCGSEVCCSEPSEEYFGEWKLEYDGITYAARVVSIPDICSADEIEEDGSYVAVTEKGRFYDAVFSKELQRMFFCIPQTEEVRGYFPAKSLPVIDSDNMVIGGLYQLAGAWGRLEKIQYLTDTQMKALELYCPVRVTMSIKGGPETCSFGIEKR